MAKEPIKSRQVVIEVLSAGPDGSHVQRCRICLVGRAKSVGALTCQIRFVLLGGALTCPICLVLLEEVVSACRELVEAQFSMTPGAGRLGKGRRLTVVFEGSASFIVWASSYRRPSAPSAVSTGDVLFWFVRSVSASRAELQDEP